MHSFINVPGLSIGMAATLLIVSYLFFELSYDRHHKNYDNTYRIYSNISLPNGNGVEEPATVGNLAPKLDDQLPAGDMNTVYIFIALSIFIILIAIVNFINLVTANSETRAKEIGLRKVVGASEGQIIKMFVISLTQWVVLAVVIAIPLSYYSMTKWLGRFVFHTDIEIWMFIFLEHS